MSRLAQYIEAAERDNTRRIYQRAGAGIGDLFHRRHDVIVTFSDKPEVNFLVHY